MTLSVQRLIRVAINLSPLAAPRRNFGILLVAGDSDVINPVERIRAYTGPEAIAADFGVNAPEHQAALLYFGQTPRPNQMQVGRWVREATEAQLRGGILTTAEQALANFTAITNGGFSIPVNGTPVAISGLNFSGATNLNGVAQIISTALAANGSAEWTGSRFIIKSDTTGAAATINYAVAPSSGTDVSTLLKLTSVTALNPINGFDAESATEAYAALADKSGAWYGFTFAASVMPDDDEIVNVAALVQAATIDRMFGVTETDTRVLDGDYEDDLGTRLRDLGYTKTTVQFSYNPFAVVSMLARAFSVNFNANNSTITLMYKVEPGIVAEDLTETQAQVLKTKRVNVFVAYDNGTAIIQNGVMSGPAFFDEIHGLAWFKDALQNALFNLLYTSKTKIPQTTAGQNTLNTQCAQVCGEAIKNGLAAPGVWNADGFGELERGDTLTEGFYIYAQSVDEQPQAEREQRVAPPIQIALKLAGAFHELDVQVDVNR